MAATGHEHLYRSTYPLQAPLEPSRRSSVATNDSDESQSRYRYSIVSQQESTVNGCPFQHTAELRGNNVSTETASLQQSLPSPVLSSPDRQSWTNRGEDVPTSIYTSSHQWTRRNYPISSTNGSSSYREHVPSASMPGHIPDRSPSRLSQASSTGTIGRTLRRTSRSRRIDSPVQVYRVHERPSTTLSRDDPQASATRNEERHQTSDSLPSTRSGVPGTFPESPVQERLPEPFALPSETQYDDSAIDQNARSVELSTKHIPDYPPIASETVDQQTHNNHDSVIHQKDNKQNGENKESWHRRAYPLQTPASNATLRNPLTPPPSPPQEVQPPSTEQAMKDQGIEEPKITAPAKSLRRQAYPLQCPASAADLRQDLATPPSEDDHDAKLSDSRLKQAHGDHQATPVGKPLRRQVYPLQSPASTVDLQHQPSTSSLYHDAATVQEQPVAQPISTDRSANALKNMRRQAYPLQSPASTTLLQQPLSQPETVKEPLSSKPILPSSQPEQAPLKSKKQSRRQAYPLQAPASVADLQHAQAPYLEDPTPDDLDEPIAERGEKQQHERKPKSLRRQAYPLQAPASTVDLNQVTKSLGPDQDADDIGESTTLHVETEKHGAPDANKSSGHQTYPLQAPAGPLALPQMPTQPQSHDSDAQPKQDLPKIQTEKIASPDTLSPLWRRQSYPLQALGDVPPSRSVTPRPSTEAIGTHPDPNSILLPKHVPAVTDVENVPSKGRTIVVCLDGTGDKFDADNSNIVHLVSALKKDDARQVTYYQAGIGTYSRNGLSSGFAAAMDMAVGSGLGEHVRDAYHFLMHSYKEGDRICIFGFSRGAYTARCLAGMVHKVGLLPPRNIQQIPFAYEFYANDTAEGWKQSLDFKKTFSIDVNIYFLGCFDSVASVGFIPRQLPLSSTPDNKPIYFRHAMALDERRAKFKICRHQTKNWDEIEDPKSAVSTILEAASSRSPTHKNQNDDPKLYSPSAYGAKNHPNLTDEEYKRLMGPTESFETDVLEVWFAGAHADVGGGAVANVERHKLAQIPLRWMIRQAFECNTGILFKTKVLAEHGLDVHTLWPKYERLKTPTHGPPPSYLERYDKGLPPRSIRQSKLVPTNKHDNGERLYHLKSHTDEDWTPEQVEDFYDAMSAINDQLIQAPSWWILELWPVQLKMPVSPGKYYVRTGMNLGRSRAVEDFEPNVHWTVLQRVQQLGYKIDVRTTKQTKWKTVV